LKSKVNVTGNENVKTVFSRIGLSSSKVDRFTSNQDQNDHQPILRIFGVYISSAEVLLFRNIRL